MADAKADKSSEPLKTPKPKKKNGRPATGQRPSVTLRLSHETLAKIEAWRTQQPEGTTRSDVIREAIDVLVSLGQIERAPPVPNPIEHDVAAEWDLFSQRSRHIVGRKPGALKTLRTRFERRRRRLASPKPNVDG